jgi:hypothetical protein
MFSMFDPSHHTHMDHGYLDFWTPAIIVEWL